MQRVRWLVDEETCTCLWCVCACTCVCTYKCLSMCLCLWVCVSVCIWGRVDPTPWVCTGIHPVPHSLVCCGWKRTTSTPHSNFGMAKVGGLMGRGVRWGGGVNFAQSPAMTLILIEEHLSGSPRLVASLITSPYHVWSRPPRHFLSLHDCFFSTYPPTFISHNY